jgi:predicted ATPase
MIRHVKIENYKSLKSAEVPLHDLTVIFGPNASGKSNLFDALNLVARLVTRKNLKEAFEGHRGLPLESVHYDKGSIASLQKEQTHSLSGVMRVMNERLAALRKRGDGEKVRNPFEELAAFYHTLSLKNPKQFDALKRAAQQLLPRLQNLEIERTDKAELYLRVWEDNTSFSNRLISEGTLRILGLLAVLSPASKSTTIGYEEPENGVHPRRLRNIAELLLNSADGTRQILIGSLRRSNHSRGLWRLSVVSYEKHLLTTTYRRHSAVSSTALPSLKRWNSILLPKMIMV